MASAFSHIAIPLAINLAAGRKYISGRLLSLGLFLSVVPDLDSIAFRFGIPYESQWGHRGFTHSLVFAGLTAILLLPLGNFFRSRRRILFLMSFLSLASHGVLDAFTNGGLGVAFLWPFSTERYFFHWQVIEVSPISITRFFTESGLRVLGSEVYYIWLPSMIIGLGIFFVRRTVTGTKLINPS